MKPMRELQVLADYTGGILAAGNTVRPAASVVGGELDSHETAEVVMLEIIPPLSVLGVPEDIRVQLRLDDELDAHMYFYGHRDRLTFAPKLAMWQNVLHALGTPLLNIRTGIEGVMDATCPKYRKRLSFDVSTVAGVTVAASYRIRAIGYRFEADQLSGLFPYQIGGAGTLRDKATGRTAFVNKELLSVNEDNWDQLPGGLKQRVPKVFQYIRQSQNLAATTPNLPYEFRFTPAAVASEEENLRWEYAIEQKILWLKGLGIRTLPASNLAGMFVDVGGDERPKNRWALTEFNNPKVFGFLQAYLGVPFYQAIPLLDDQILISGENVGVKVVDNGVACAANSLFVAVSGIHIDLT